MGIFAGCVNRVRLWRVKRQFAACIRDGALDLLLEVLLAAMSIYMRINKKYRKNIEGFNARYSFKSDDGRIDAGVIFADNKMTVCRNAVDAADITVRFRDGRALREFLFSESPDIIGAVLNGDVSYTGNLNYLSKFVFMAKNLKLQLLSR